MGKESGLVKYIAGAYNAKGLGQAIKGGAWKAVINGNLAESLLIHGKDATLVGTDYNGNKYFEDLGKQYGRHRWVIYGNLKNNDPMTVPPEWHSWLHCISDAAPSRTEIPKAPYALQAVGTVTGTAAAYKPKGDWFNAKPRNWQKVEAWTPPKK